MLGKRLAHYLIIDKLGHGGMGVVYRARDTHLDRFVALKVLPPEKVSDPGRKRRFVQEAKAASALNHPNIVHIYDISQADGVDYIAMELVEGRTLGDAIGVGGLRTDQVLKYGIQIADALAKSHGAGIIHRDLKPTNIMVTESGLVKILDFGLAKLAERSSEEAISTAFTAASPHTEEGTIVGTVAYMSPEQAEGQPVDGRSDIFSLGAVLYEMVSGRRAFQGDSRMSTLAAILREQPAPLPATAPSGIRAVIHRCLVKETGQRYQHATEVRAGLEVIQDVSSDQTAVSREISAPPRRRSRPIIATAAVMLLVSLALAAWRLREGRPPQPTAQRLVSTFPGSHRSPSFSPDGSMMAFISSVDGVPQVWVKNLAEGDPIQITRHGNGGVYARWSPKNDQIVFGVRGQGIWSVPPLGGAPRRIIENGRNANFSWDGERLVYEVGREIWTAKSDGSGARNLNIDPKKVYNIDSLPSFSPDGRTVAFFRPEFGPTGDLWVVKADGKARRLTFDTRLASGPVWTPDGRWILYASARAGSTTLWRIPSKGGEPQPVTSGAGEDMEPALSADGKKLLYTNVRNDWTLTVMDPRTGEQKQILERRSDLLYPSFSPAGDRIAFFHAVGGDAHVFTIGVDGKDLRQMTHGKGESNTMPRWSADGSFLYFYRARPVVSYQKVSLNGGSSVEVAPWAFDTHTSAREDPSGRFLVYALSKSFKPEATIVRELSSGHEKNLAVPLYDPCWSPDGKFISGMTRDGTLVLCPTSGAVCETLSKGFRPAWPSDGSKLYFLRAGAVGEMPELWLMVLKDRSEKKVATLGPFRPIDLTFDVSSDGRIVSAPFREGRYELWLADMR